MKRTILIMLGLIALMHISAEEKVRTFDLTLEAIQKVSPDMMRINIGLAFTAKNEQDALNRLNAGIDEKIRSIEKASFKKDQVRISDFNIEEMTVWDGTKQKNIGFKAIQTLKILIPIAQKETIDKLLGKLSVDRNENVTLSVNTEISNELSKQVQNELIKKAILDAKTKAQLMADALGVRLGAIKSVDYNDNQYRPIPQRSAMRMNMADASMAKESTTYQTLDVAETELSERIHIVWIIE